MQDMLASYGLIIALLVVVVGVLLFIVGTITAVIVLVVRRGRARRAVSQ